MPISGEVVEFNNDLEEKPELINSDPYKSGWIIKILITDPSELDVLLDASEYKNLVSR